MNTSIMQCIGQRIQRAYDDGVFPGCVVGIVTSSGQRAILPFGHFTNDPLSRSVCEDSLFDVASITKSIPTSSLMLKLLEDGSIGLDDHVIDILPEIRNEYRERILMRHLLTHTLNFGIRMSAYKDLPPLELLDAIYGAKLTAAPGESFYYTNATSILMGIVVERVYGKSLDVLARELFFEPLSMHRTSFFPETFDREDIMPTEIDSWRGRTVQGEIHDESSYTLRKAMIAGSAGLFTTVPDVLNFIEMMLKGGVYNGTRLLSEQTLCSIETNQTTLPGIYSGLGWELYQPRYMGQYCTEHTFGKTGFTGCVCVADRKKSIGFVLLSNYTYPHRKNDVSIINSVRCDIADIVFSLSEV